MESTNPTNNNKSNWMLFVNERQSDTNRRPSFVHNWTDQETGATGFVVIDCSINAVAGGGIFMHAHATVDETADIARNMSRKFTVCDPQIGGAKAGIRFDHRDPRAKDVLRRFIVDNVELLRSCWVTAGDLNTDDQFINRTIQSLGLPTCQSLLARRIAEKTGTADRSDQLAALLGAPACVHFPLVEAAVGYGVAAAIQRAIAFVGAPGAADRPLTVAIQGFGAVGSSLAYYLTTRRIATVVAIADKDGFVVNPDGIDVHALLDARRARLACAQLSDAERAECSKNFMCNMSDDELARIVPHSYRRGKGDDDAAFLVRFLQACDAEIISLCAGRYQLTQRVVDEGLVQGAWRGDGVAFGSVVRRPVRAKIVACGANNPFGVVGAGGVVSDDRAYAVAAGMVELGVCIVPDWVANSGTAQLFHRGLSVKFDLQADPAALADTVLESTAAPIRAFLDVAFNAHAGGSPPYLLLGCERLAQERLANPIAMAPPLATQPHALVPSNPARSLYALAPLPLTKQLPLAERERLCRSMMREVVDCDGATLLDLLRASPNPVAYDGFEPSGRMHIAQGIMKATIVDRLTRSGFTFLFWVADWFAWMNHKMGGDLEAIKTVGRYFIEVWRAVGMDMSRVRFLWASEEFSKRHNEYWPMVIEIMTTYTVKQMAHCATVMGRKESANLSASQLLYPAMQCADVFFLGVDAAQLGLDQRKVNMRAREFAETAAGQRRGLTKPIVLSHPMLPGLKAGQEKMSKSDPESAVFMEDSEADVNRKIKAAFCPERIVGDEPTNEDANDEQSARVSNPVCEYLKHVVFPKEEDDGRLPLAFGDVAFGSFAEFAAAYKEGKVHPKDAKQVLAERLNAYIEPVRKHFRDNEEARQLFETVRALTAPKA